MDVFCKGIFSAFLLLLILCAFLREDSKTLCKLRCPGLAITCYMCNSAPTRNSKACGIWGEDKSIYEQDCDHLTEAIEKKVNYTVCRKMYQKIFDKDGNLEERIIRQCGTHGPLHCDRKSRSISLQVETCHCNVSLCNTAISYRATAWIWIALLIGALWVA